MKHKAKRILSLTLALVLLLSTVTVPASAQALSGTCGTDATWTLDTETGVLTISGTGDMTAFATTNRPGWYEYVASVKTVVIESGITNVSAYAFDAHSNLASVTIPETVTIIKQRAFRDCTSLESIIIPASVTKIEQYGFNRCTALTSVTFLSKTVEIVSTSFNGCTNPTITCYTGSTAQTFAQGKSWSVVLLDGTEEPDPEQPDTPEETVFQGTCGTNASWSLDTVTGALTISGSGDMTSFSTSNRPGWYEYAASIKTADIADGITNIGNRAFQDCANLTSVSIPASVTEIKEYAFDGCSNLESLSIPAAVDTIGQYAFRDCAKIQSAVIPDGVTEIKRGTFSGCAALTSVTVPSSVKTFGTGIFTNAALVNISCYTNSPAHTYATENSLAYTLLDEAPENPDTPEETVFQGTCGEGVNWLLDTETGILTISGEGEMESYSSSSNAPWYGKRAAIKTAVIESGVTSVGSYAFNECTSLESVSIPATVTRINNYAFRDCTALSSVDMSEGLVDIIQYAFYNCTSLASITLPSTVATIGAGTFNGCSALTSVVIPDGVTEIKQYTFYNCPALASVTVPSSVTAIAARTFNDSRSPELTINCYTGSAAHTFATDNGISFTLIDGTAEPAPVTVTRTYFQINKDTTAASASSDIRFIAGASALNCKAVGFIFSLHDNALDLDYLNGEEFGALTWQTVVDGGTYTLEGTVNAQGQTYFKLSTVEVYGSINADGEVIAADELGGSYLFAVTFTGVPAEHFDSVFTARTFVLSKGITTYCEELTQNTITGMIP